MKDPTDTFEDVPLDTRHHPIKVKPKFPIAWRMTEERKALLETEREQTRLLEEKKVEQGAIIDGVQQIAMMQVAMDRLRATEAANPLAVAAGKDSKGKKRLAVKR